MNIANHIHNGAREHPRRLALLFEGRGITYLECARGACGAAGAFAAAGVRSGDRVALLLPNITEFVLAYLGVLQLGAIAVSINVSSKPDEVDFILDDCGAKVVVTMPESRGRAVAGGASTVLAVGEDFEPAMDAASPILAPVRLDPEEPAAIVYTSGTTGRPKGATLSHTNIVRNCEAKVRYLGIRPDDRGLLFLPLHHCFGQNAVLNAFLQAGATIVLHRRFDLERVLNSIATDDVTMFFGVPTTYALLVDEAPRSALESVRFYFSAAAPLPLEVERRWARRFGAPIYQGYGLTETSPFASYNHAERHRPGSVGTPIDGVEMKIVDPASGREVASGETGEIVVRGHNVMVGYWNRPMETAKVIRDGWFHTGDIGRVDRDGYFYIEDRLTDVIIAGGVNVYPAEIERVLRAHPAVAEVAVYGMPEPICGERVCAEVVLEPAAAASEQELRAFCAERLAEVKVPTTIGLVPEIPKGPTGKVLKRVLRERARTRPAGGAGRRVTSDEARRWIGAWIRSNIDSPPGVCFDSAAAFVNLGMNSVGTVRLALALTDWLGRDVAVSAVWNHPSTDALADHLARRDRSYPAGSLGIASEGHESAELLLLQELDQLSR